MKFVAWMGLALVLVGCQAKLDGSSPKALLESAKKMVDSAPQGERSALAADIKTVAPGIEGLAVVVSLGVDQVDAGAKSVLATLNGLTAEQVHEKAQAVRVQQAAADKAHKLKLAEEEVAELRKNLEASRLKAKAFESFKVASFEADPIVEDFALSIPVTVTNGSELRISKVSFQVRGDTGGRLQWEKTMDADVEIQPGETKRILLSIGQARHFPDPIKILGVTAAMFSSADVTVVDMDVDRVKTTEERLKTAEKALASLQAG